MITLLSIIACIITGSITGIIFASYTCKSIPDGVNLKSKYWKKVQRKNILLMIIGGLIGAIIFPLFYML